jgi:C4-dicarboxylate transporter DctM subunit
LLTPVIILGGIYSGIFTPTEASAVSCLYAIIIGLFVYKELTLKKLLQCLYGSIKLIGQILCIVAVTQLFSWLMTRAGLPQTIAQWCLSLSTNPVVFLFLTMLVLLIVGCFLDPVPAVLIFAPILTPPAVAMGISPIHFGVIMVTTFCVGLITPPVGMTLYVAAGIGKRPVMEISKKIMPFVLAMVLAIIFLIFFPGISTWLPSVSK